MKFRSPGLFAVLLSILIVGSEFDDSPRAEDALQEVSSVDAARARFLNRIREMLGESAKMDAAGRPQDAMLLAVRASRMLKALGGESAWPRGEASPAEVVAVLAGRDRSAPPVQTERPRPEPQPQPSVTVAQPAKPDTPKEAPSGESLTAFNRFPELPAASRSWVPVGAPERKSGDWTPIAPAPTSKKAHPVQQTGAQQPIPIFTDTDKLPEHGGGTATSDAAKISDRQVGPIPVHLSPEVLPATGIDIRASDEPQEFRTDAEPVPMTDLLPEASAASPSEASVTQPRSIDDSSEAAQTTTIDAEAGNSRLLLATLAGAAAGVLLVLIGGFLTRRFVRTTTATVANGSHKNTSVKAAVPVNAGQVRSASVPEVAWQPGASWVDSPSEPQFAVPVEASFEAQSPKPATLPQLQIFHGASEHDTDVEAENVVAADSNAERDVADKSVPPVTPAVPFRVIGTAVVLGEAASAEVDEELQHRRKKIMQAVFEENVATQSSLNNTHGGEAA